MILTPHGHRLIAKALRCYAEKLDKDILAMDPTRHGEYREQINTESKKAMALAQVLEDPNVMLVEDEVQHNIGRIFKKLEDVAKDLLRLTESVHYRPEDAP